MYFSFIKIENYESRLECIQELGMRRYFKKVSNKSDTRMEEEEVLPLNIN